MREDGRIWILAMSATAAEDRNITKLMVAALRRAY